MTPAQASSNRPTPAHPPVTGFTLIELAIVLVIIGLIVGGILVGQDLVQAAKIRAFVSQIERYNTAANAFRLKYGDLPGDIPPGKAGAYGLAMITGGNAGKSAGTLGYGDGNGFIDSPQNSGANFDFAGEPLLFWRHLTDSELLPGALGASINLANGGSGSFLNPATIMKYLPQLPFDKNGYIAVGSAGNGINYFITFGFFSPAYITTPEGGLAWGSDTLKPAEAFAIDNKIDDGAPLAGTVQAMSATVSAGFPTLSEISSPPVGTLKGLCATAAGTAYNISGRFACSLRIKTMF